MVPEGSHPLGIHLSVPSLDRESILRELIGGRYHIGIPSFRSSAVSTFSPGALAYFRALHIPLECAKSLRDRLNA